MALRSSAFVHHRPSSLSLAAPQLLLLDEVVAAALSYGAWLVLGKSSRRPLLSTTGKSGSGRNSVLLVGVQAHSALVTVFVTDLLLAVVLILLACCLGVGHVPSKTVRVRVKRLRKVAVSACFAVNVYSVGQAAAKALLVGTHVAVEMEEAQASAFGSVSCPCCARAAAVAGWSLPSVSEADGMAAAFAVLGEAEAEEACMGDAVGRVAIAEAGTVAAAGVGSRVPVGSWGRGVWVTEAEERSGVCGSLAGVETEGGEGGLERCAGLARPACDGSSCRRWSWGAGQTALAYLDQSSRLRSVMLGWRSCRGATRPHGWVSSAEVSSAWCGRSFVGRSLVAGKLFPGGGGGRYSSRLLLSINKAVAESI